VRKNHTQNRYRLIMGKNCIEELLKTAPERLVEVFTCKQDANDPIARQLQKKKIPLKVMDKASLTKLVQSESHQSYVASVKERGLPGLKEFFEEFSKKERSLCVMLDSIYDPQNLGAIFRAAECFGADLILFSKNRGADITPVVSKVSSGATEYVPFVKVSNLAETVRQFKKEGFWVVSADVVEGAESVYDFEYPEKTLLILGSEGEGIQPLILKNSDYRLMIPMLGKIDSLNVSQAAAVFLSSYRQKHSTSSKGNTEHL
jgi:23S rRNA (guanosine2251-2'-O)-methyltransferase